MDAPTELPCDCGHDEDHHLHLFTSNRCTQCDCEGYEPIAVGVDD